MFSPQWCPGGLIVQNAFFGDNDGDEVDGSDDDIGNAEGSDAEAGRDGVFRDGFT